MSASFYSIAQVVHGLSCSFARCPKSARATLLPSLAFYPPPKPSAGLGS